MRVDYVSGDDTGPDGLGDMRAENQEGDEIEEGGPEYGMLRAHHAGRDDGGDRVRRVMQAVEKVEGEGHHDEPDQDRECKRDGIHFNQKPGLSCATRVAHTFSSILPWISLETSS